MYFVSDRKSAIFDVQKFLFVIGQSGDLPHLSVDGFYSEETRLVVREFQKARRLKETGVVDRETFDAIYAEYEQTVGSKNASVYSMPQNVYPMKLGDSGNAVSYLNLVLRELSRFYRDIPKPAGNFYSVNTFDAVKAMQRILRKNENGETTVEFFDLLRKELNIRQKFSNV